MRHLILRLFVFLTVTFSVPAHAEEGGSWLDNLFSWFPTVTWITKKLNQIIQTINKFITDIWDTVLRFFKELLLTILDMLKDFFIWIFSQVMDLTIYILNGLGELLSTIDITSLVTGLPESVTNMMGLLGLGHCLTVIATACIIRILLQLIPFVRLGS